MYRTRVDLEGDRTSAREVPTVVPVCGLVHSPAARFTPRVEDLRETACVELVIRHHHSVLRIEANLRVTVDHAAVHWHAVDNLGVLNADWQRQRLPRAGLPMHEVAATRIRKIVVGGAIRRVAPSPDEVKVAIGPNRRADQIGVHLALTVGERLVDQPLPTTRFRIIDIVDLITRSAAPVTVSKNEFAGWTVEKLGIGAAVLIAADHARNTFERPDIERFGRAEVNQRGRVHVAGDVNIALAVDGERDGVVAVPPEFRGQSHELPLGGT